MALLGNRTAARDARSWWRDPRWAGGALAALVHIALVSFLLLSLPKGVSPLPLPHEVFFIFKPQPEKPLPHKIEPVGPPRPQSVPPLFRYDPAPSTAITLPPQTPSQNGLTLSLFGCAPENLAYLSPEQRSHCGSLTAASISGRFPGEAHDLSLQGERWEQGIRDRNTPLAVPCFSTAGGHTNSVGPSASSAGMGIDPLCAAKVLGKMLEK